MGDRSERRVWCAALCLASAAAPALAAAEQGHVQEHAGWRNQPVSIKVMDGRIEAAAAEYGAKLKEAGIPAGTQVFPRIALTDVAYPANGEEYAALAGCAVLLVTALAWEKNELPLKRVYVRSGSKRVALQGLTVLLSRQPAQRASAGIFGPHRMDALYLLPVKLIATKAQLMADFARNREGFGLVTFDGTLRDDLAWMRNARSRGETPSKEALARMLDREFPGLASR